VSGRSIGTQSIIILVSPSHFLSLLYPHIYAWFFFSLRTPMAGTFDPNQAQNLAEVRHPVPRALRWLLRVLFAAGVV
jgi:hypothetical protein